jgi:hypothetical protein
MANSYLKQNFSLAASKIVFMMGGLTFSMNSAAAPVSGRVSSFGQLPRDDVIDGAFVIPSMKSLDIISFQFDGLMGPSEEMPIGPVKAKVPGNIFFPNQQERYGIFPITIKKELFNLNLEAGIKNELIALRFQAPFSKTADLARNNAPYSEILPLISLKNFSYGANQDWSRVAPIDLPLNRTLNKTVSYRWTRPAAAANHFDLLIAFQQTPANRWAPTDIQGKFPISGSIQSGQNYLPRMKTLLARITNDAQGDPESAQGWFREISPSGSVNLDGLPPPITGASATESQIRWNAISSNGWMAVIRGTILNQNSFEAIELNELQKALGVFGNFGISTLLKPFGAALEQWVDASSGSYSLSSPRTANEKVSLVFIGTDRPVAAPLQKEIEPELFTFATQMRMVVVK